MRGLAEIRRVKLCCGMVPVTGTLVWVAVYDDVVVSCGDAEHVGCLIPMARSVAASARIVTVKRMTFRDEVPRFSASRHL
jgi:hypothetical protein